ncbi:MAG: hypothetical protein U0736_03775 [Gemmataceae bacterium]
MTFQQCGHGVLLGSSRKKLPRLASASSPKNSSPQEEQENAW